MKLSTNIKCKMKKSLRILPFVTCPRPLVIESVFDDDGGDDIRFHFMVTSLELMMTTTTIQPVHFRPDHFIAKVNCGSFVRIEQNCSTLLTVVVLVVFVAAVIAVVVVSIHVSSLANPCDLSKLKIDDGLC